MGILIATPQEHHGSWLSLPYGHQLVNQLASALGVRTIPSVFILNAVGQSVTEGVREKITNAVQSRDDSVVLDTIAQVCSHLFTTKDAIRTEANANLYGSLSFLRPIYLEINERTIASGGPLRENEESLLIYRNGIII